MKKRRNVITKGDMRKKKNKKENKKGDEKEIKGRERRDIDNFAES